MYFSLKESFVIVSFVLLSVLGVSYAAPQAPAPTVQTFDLIKSEGSNGPQSKLGESAGNRTASDVVRRALAIGIEASPTTQNGQTFLTPPLLGQTVHVNGLTKIGSTNLSTDGLIVDGDVIISGTSTIDKTTSTSTDGDVTVTDLAGSGSSISTVCIAQNTLILC